MTGGGAVIGSEHDDLGGLLLGEPPDALGGRGADHDPALDAEVTEHARATVEQSFGVVFGEPLAVALGVHGVTDVREDQLGPRVAQDTGEHQRVVIVRGVVVGDDGLG